MDGSGRPADRGATSTGSGCSRASPAAGRRATSQLEVVSPRLTREPTARRRAVARRVRAAVGSGPGPSHPRRSPRAAGDRNGAVRSPPDQVRARRVPDPARLVQHRRRPAGRRHAVPAAPPGHACSPSGRTTWRRCSRWRSSARRCPASARSRSRSRSATPTACTGRARCTAPTGSSRRSIRPAHIYYKYEGVSPAGSHKPNTALPQAFYNKEAGRQAHRDRDRRRPVGERHGVRRRHVRPRGQGLHGPRQLRPEAVPPDPDGDVRRRGRGQPVA